MKTAVIVSANAEWQALGGILGDNVQDRQPYPYGETFTLDLNGRAVCFFHGGWGKVSAAASAQWIIDHQAPDLLVNLGTCGGFAGHIRPGTIILADRTIIYDIFEQMGDSQGALDHYASDLDLGWLPEPYPFPVSRSLLVSADRDILVEDIPMLIEKHRAVAADWESGAIAWVARHNKTRLLILRGVSDVVSSEGGEAYGNLTLFEERTRVIMAELLRQLPGWLRHLE